MQKRTPLGHDQNIIEHFPFHLRSLLAFSILRVYILLLAALVTASPLPPPAVRNRSLLGLSRRVLNRLVLSVSSFQNDLSPALSDLTLDTPFPPSTDSLLCRSSFSSKFLKLLCACTDRPFSNSLWTLPHRHLRRNKRIESKDDDDDDGHVSSSLPAINKSLQPNLGSVFDTCFCNSLAVRFIS